MRFLFSACKPDALPVLINLRHPLLRSNSISRRSIGRVNRRIFTYFQGPDNFGTLEVSGYLRGMPLSVNGLVHIPGFGDYQLSRIDAPGDPWPLEKARAKDTPEDDASLDTGRILEVADPKRQESLESENTPDPMEAEQTWPTDEEMAQADALQKRKLVKLVPKGTSEYQAAWIPDEDAGWRYFLHLQFDNL